MENSKDFMKLVETLKANGQYKVTSLFLWALVKSAAKYKSDTHTEETDDEGYKADCYLGSTGSVLITIGKPSILRTIDPFKQDYRFWMSDSTAFPAIQTTPGEEYTWPLDGITDVSQLKSVKTFKGSLTKLGHFLTSRSFPLLWRYEETGMWRSQGKMDTTKHSDIVPIVDSPCGLETEHENAIKASEMIFYREKLSVSGGIVPFGQGGAWTAWFLRYKSSVGTADERSGIIVAQFFPEEDGRPRHKTVSLIEMDRDGLCGIYEKSCCLDPDQPSNIWTGEWDRHPGSEPTGVMLRFKLYCGD